jgi:methionyl-tRNA formyltransferase
MQPWPKAYTQWERPGASPLRLILTRVRVVRGAAPSIAMAGDAGDIVFVSDHNPRDRQPPERRLPGLVIEAGDDLVIEAGEDAVQIDELQPAGRRAMSTEEFLRGYPLQPGQQLVTPFAAGP